MSNHSEMLILTLLCINQIRINLVYGNEFFILLDL